MIEVMSQSSGEKALNKEFKVNRKREEKQSATVVNRGENTNSAGVNTDNSKNNENLQNAKVFRMRRHMKNENFADNYFELRVYKDSKKKRRNRKKKNTSPEIPSPTSSGISKQSKTKSDEKYINLLAKIHNVTPESSNDQCSNIGSSSSHATIPTTTNLMNTNPSPTTIDNSSITNNENNVPVMMIGHVSPYDTFSTESSSGNSSILSQLVHKTNNLYNSTVFNNYYNNSQMLIPQQLPPMVVNTYPNLINNNNSTHFSSNLNNNIVINNNIVNPINNVNQNNLDFVQMYNSFMNSIRAFNNCNNQAIFTNENSSVVQQNSFDNSNINNNNNQTIEMNNYDDWFQWNENLPLEIDTTISNNQENNTFESVTPQQDTSFSFTELLESASNNNTNNNNNNTQDNSSLLLEIIQSLLNNNNNKN
ncbi:hypothetical protein ABK040_003663 [Willaertia magna]